MNTRLLIETYHEAWTTGDFERARACLADDVDFKGSIDTFRNADALINALKPFQRMLRKVTLLKSIAEPGSGALLYDCDTASPAGVVRTAEFFTTRDGKIVEIRLVFDATELRKMVQP